MADAANESNKKMGSSFPTDILLDILSRLPVKSLGKFRCVSKEWRRIIMDPYFISMHKDFCLRNPSYLSVSTTPEETQLVPERTRIDICEFNFDGSSKGADFSFYVDGICVQTIESKGDLVALASDTSLYVCNPSAQVVKKLPDPNFCTFTEYLQVEMGYFKHREEYVLVNLFDLTSELFMRCQMLRLKEGKQCEWKSIDATCPLIVSSGVFVDSTFYWRHSVEYPPEDDDFDCIVSFDPESETFGTILPPEISPVAFCRSTMADIGGELCLLHDHSIAEVWVLKDPKNHAWICQYRVDISGYFHTSLITLVRLWVGKGLADALSKGLDKDVVSGFVKLLAKRGDWIQPYVRGFFQLVSPGDCDAFDG